MVAQQVALKAIEAVISGSVEAAGARGTFNSD